jgi:hypothetical protein
MSSRWLGFYACENGDETFHILVTDDDGGRIFADQIADRAEAEWMCSALTAALSTTALPNSRTTPGPEEVAAMRAEERCVHCGELVR